MVDREIRETVLEVRRVNDKIISMKTILGGVTLNAIDTYASQVDLDGEGKNTFLGEVGRGWERYLID